MTLPICLLLYLILTKECSRSEYLYDEINHCNNATYVQVILLVLLISGSFMSQFLHERRAAIIKWVQVGCPLVILAWVVWLECLHFKIVLLGLYVLSYCL